MNDQQRPEYEELSRLALLAQEQGRGLHGPESAAAVRNVKWAGTFDGAELLARCKGTPQPAVVEQVPSGSIVRVIMLPGFEQVTIIMAGIQAPSIRRKPDGTEDAEPFSREA